MLALDLKLLCSYSCYALLLLQLCSTVAPWFKVTLLFLLLLLLLYSCSTLALPQKYERNNMLYAISAYTLLVNSNSNFLHHITLFSYFLRHMNSNFMQHSELIFRSLYVNCFRTFSDMRISNFFMYPAATTVHVGLSFLFSALVERDLHRFEFTTWLCNLGYQ